MLSILEQVNQFLWGFPLLALLAGAHLFFTVKLKFPQKYTLKAIRLSVTPEEGNGSGTGTSDPGQEEPGTDGGGSEPQPGDEEPEVPDVPAPEENWTGYY